MENKHYLFAAVNKGCYVCNYEQADKYFLEMQYKGEKKVVESPKYNAEEIGAILFALDSIFG